MALALVLKVQGPGTVDPLMPSNPGQAVFHGLLGVNAPSFAADELGPAQPLAAGKRGGDHVGEARELRPTLEVGRT
ncbi:MAG: hypothetical protein ACLP7Q_01910 [Isosphaeraceae bacterium]